MDNIKIVRFDKQVDRVLGVLFINGKSIGYTLEPPWKYNETGISCIPEGIYEFKIYQSKKYKRKCLKLFNVPDRSYISVHNGNYPKNTKGCVLVGLNIQDNRLGSSRLALGVIISSLKNQKGIIEIH